MSARTRHLVQDLDPGAQILTAHIFVIATLVMSSRQDRRESAKVLPKFVSRVLLEFRLPRKIRERGNQFCCRLGITRSN